MTESARKAYDDDETKKIKDEAESLKRKENDKILTKV
jgi:hypothetical protein